MAEPRLRQAFRRWPAITVVAVCALASISCKRTGDLAESPSTTQSSPAWQGTASQLLKTIFTRYRNAVSYHDEGRVRLSYLVDDQSHSETAPLSVTLDADAIDVRAYDVRLHKDDGQLSAWIDDPSTNHFDSQALRVAVPAGRPILDSILADPVLADHLQSGLAGPPPQLEWLLADEPMKKLFDDEHQFAFASESSVAGHACHVVRVDAQGDRYQFWIDQKEGVIRRVELPNSTLSSQLTLATELKLTLELDGATFRSVSSSDSQNSGVTSPPGNAKWVGRFVPLPPIEPAPILGSRPDGFQLKNAVGEVTLSASGRPQPIRVLGRFAGGDDSVAAAALLQNWNSRLPPNVRARTQVIIVVDRAAADQIPTPLTLPIAIDNDHHAERQFAITPGGLTILDPDGQIAWVQPQVTPAALVAAGTIIGDIIEGVDVPRRLRQQWGRDIQAYQEALEKASVRVGG
tara:strand:+ start:95438 stop:96820 length:1383 start_codon:yes stop_codon:yes gene_type:complete